MKFFRLFKGKRGFRATAILFLAMVLVAEVLFFAPPKAMAAKSIGCHYYYFDSSMQQVVYLYTDCSGNILDQWGIETGIVQGGCNCEEN